MNIDKVRTGQLIADQRKALHMTQNDLAEKLHISAKAISKWERAQNFPNIDILHDLADILQLKVNDLFAGKPVELNSFIFNKDWNILYLKNCSYIKYLRIMELIDVNEELILNCVLNDYYCNFKEEIDAIYQNECKTALMYGNNYKKNMPDIYLSIQNSFSVANSIINKGPANADSIEEANFNVYFLESDLAALIYSDIYNIRKLTLAQRESYNEILNYLIVRCDMKECIRIFNTLGDTRAYKRALSIIHSNYYEYIEKYFDDDLLKINEEYIFAEDYDIKEIIWEFRESVHNVDYGIFKAINSDKFIDEKILEAMDKLGFCAAILTMKK